jgi:hypothetical protein
VSWPRLIIGALRSKRGCEVGAALAVKVEWSSICSESSCAAALEVEGYRCCEVMKKGLRVAPTRIYSRYASHIWEGLDGEEGQPGEYERGNFVSDSTASPRGSASPFRIVPHTGWRAPCAVRWPTGFMVSARLR